MITSPFRQMAGSWRWVPRSNPRLPLRIAVPAVGVLVGVLVASVLIEAVGYDSVAILGKVIQAGYLGGRFAWSDTLSVAAPLILCGGGCALAFRAGLWNIGAEGQLLMGAWAATGVATWICPESLPGPLAWLFMLVAGFSAGAVWGAVPALLKVRFRTSEILTTLMLVYVASHWVSYFVYVRWSVGGFQMTPLLPRHFWFPRLSDLETDWTTGMTVHLGLLVALSATAVVGWVQSRTAWGYQLRVTGHSPRVARYAGMPAARNLVLAMALSGGLAGLAGVGEVAGVAHRLQDNLSPGYGFTAILVAWLARLNAWVVMAVSILVAGLLVGALRVQPGGVAMLLQGCILLGVVASNLLLRYRPVRSSRNEETS